jgi:hypothetical protein
MQNTVLQCWNTLPHQQNNGDSICLNRELNASPVGALTVLAC